MTAAEASQMPTRRYRMTRRRYRSKVGPGGRKKEINVHKLDPRVARKEKKTQNNECWRINRRWDLLEMLEVTKKTKSMYWSKEEHAMKKS